MTNIDNNIKLFFRFLKEESVFAKSCNYADAVKLYNSINSLSYLIEDNEDEVLREKFAVTSKNKHIYNIYKKVASELKQDGFIKETDLIRLAINVAYKMIKNNVLDSIKGELSNGQ